MNEIKMNYFITCKFYFAKGKFEYPLEGGQHKDRNMFLFFHFCFLIFLPIKTLNQ